MFHTKSRIFALTERGTTILWIWSPTSARPSGFSSTKMRAENSCMQNLNAVRLKELTHRLARVVVKSICSVGLERSCVRIGRFFQVTYASQYHDTCTVQEHPKGTLLLVALRRNDENHIFLAIEREYSTQIVLNEYMMYDTTMWCHMTYTTTCHALIGKYIKNQ